MPQFAKVAEKKDFVVKKSKRITVEGIDLALFSLNGKFHAVQNDCPHQHFSAMHEGILNGQEITCPMHGWTFDLTTGKATIGGGRLKVFEVKTEGDDIFVEIPDSTPEWARS